MRLHLRQENRRYFGYFEVQGIVCTSSQIIRRSILCSTVNYIQDMLIQLAWYSTLDPHRKQPPTIPERELSVTAIVFKHVFDLL